MIGVVLALSVRRGSVVAEGLALAVGVGQLDVEGGPVALTLQIALPARTPNLTCKITIISLCSISSCVEDISSRNAGLGSILDTV